MTSAYSLLAQLLARNKNVDKILTMLALSPLLQDSVTIFKLRYQCVKVAKCVKEGKTPIICGKMFLLRCHEQTSEHHVTMSVYLNFRVDCFSYAQLDKFVFAASACQHAESSQSWADVQSNVVTPKALKN